MVVPRKSTATEIISTAFLLLIYANTFQNSRSEPSGMCPLSSVGRCFALVFATHSPHYLASSLSSSTTTFSSCQLFEPLEKCFTFVQCTETEMAQLAAVEYFKLFKNFIPKEAVLAFRASLRGKCQPHCIRHAEHKCRLEMRGDDRDKDNALVLELHAIKLQLYLRVTDPKEGCPRLDIILARINYHRRNNCKLESMWCLCKHLKDKLLGVCTVNCTMFKNSSLHGFYYSNTGSVSTYANFPLSQYVCLVLLAIFCLCSC